MSLYSGSRRKLLLISRRNLDALDGRQSRKKSGSM